MKSTPSHTLFVRIDAKTMEPVMKKAINNNNNNSKHVNRPRPKLDGMLLKWLQNTPKLPNVSNTDTDTGSLHENSKNTDNTGSISIRSQSQDASVIHGSSNADAHDRANAITAIAIPPPSLPPSIAVHDYHYSLQKELNILTDSSTVSQRKFALNHIKSLLFHTNIIECNDNCTNTASKVHESKEDDNNELNSGTKLGSFHVQQLQAAFGVSIKPLLKRFADVNEPCRQLAIEIITLSVPKLGDIYEWLSYIFPIIAYRMGTNQHSSEHLQIRAQRDHSSIEEPPKLDIKCIESSEEIRHQLFNLIYEILIQCCPPLPEKLDPYVDPPPHLHHFSPFFADVCLLLYAGLNDKSAQVKIRVSECLVVLCKGMREHMRGYSLAFCKFVMPFLRHKLAKVRISAVKAIGCLVACGAAELIRDLAAFREHNIIDIHAFYHGEARQNYMALLVNEENSKVRLSFYEMICEWITKLYERADYETLIMPYVLSGLADQISEIQLLVHHTIILLGEEYERDHENELQDEKYYFKEYEKITRPHLQHLPIILPAPFTARPSIGSRNVVLRFVPRLLPALTNELTDWKEITVQHSLCLLRTLLVYSEEYITPSVPKLIRAFYPLVQQKTLANNEVLIMCLHLIGRYANSQTLFNVILSDLFHNADMDKRHNILIVTKYILQMAPPTLLHNHITKLLMLLSAEEWRITDNYQMVYCVTDILAQISAIQLPLQSFHSFSYPLFVLLLTADARFQVSPSSVSIVSKEGEALIEKCMLKLNSIQVDKSEFIQQILKDIQTGKLYQFNISLVQDNDIDYLNAIVNKKHVLLSQNNTDEENILNENILQSYKDNIGFFDPMHWKFNNIELVLLLALSRKYRTLLYSQNKCHENTLGNYAADGANVKNGSNIMMLCNICTQVIATNNDSQVQARIIDIIAQILDDPPVSLAFIPCDILVHQIIIPTFTSTIDKFRNSPNADNKQNMLQNTTLIHTITNLLTSIKNICSQQWLISHHAYTHLTECTISLLSFPQLSYSKAQILECVHLLLSSFHKHNENTNVESIPSPFINMLCKDLLPITTARLDDSNTQIKLNAAILINDCVLLAADSKANNRDANDSHDSKTLENLLLPTFHACTEIVHDPHTMDNREMYKILTDVLMHMQAFSATFSNSATTHL